MTKTKVFKCKHYKGDGFGYDLPDNQELLLCSSCNMYLSGEVFQQVAVTAMIPTFRKQ